METQTQKTLLSVKQQVKQLREEVTALKLQLLRPHFAKSAENDYDIKSVIIEKQTRMIELLLEQADENIKE